MALEVERYIRIHRPVPAGGRVDWRTLPNADRVSVMDHSVVDALDDEASEDPSPKRYIFLINFVQGVERGCRVTYLGQKFTVLSFSDATRLLGLELRCVPATDP